MRSTRPAFSILFLLFLTFCSTTIIARAAGDEAEEADDYDVKARVVRISLITGEVNLKRDGNTDWERARLNYPLVEGDTIATGSTDRSSRVEIQIDARNFVRLGSNSILRLVTLRDEGVALSVVEGTASIRLAKFDRDHEYFEVDAPKTTLAAEKKGVYRIDVSHEGRVRFAARDGGRARIYSETSGFALRDGRSAELILDGDGAGDWEFVASSGPDSWDNWVDERERYLAQRLRYDVQYYDSYMWGAEDLDAYGDWTYANDYGWIWRPRTTVINNYYNWAPYRYGRWTWCPPYGWTWVGNEPWGWAPYHYGRWVYHNNYWAWCPRSHYYRHRSWWRPALVAFNISFGNQVYWYPLNYRQRDPRSRHYQADRHRNPLPGSQAGVGPRPMRSDELADLRRVNPAYLRAVTSQAATDFGADAASLRPVDATLARRVVTAEPLRTDLPVRPAYANNPANAGDRTGVTVARPVRVAPVELPRRQTGASERSPGVPLDDELRRSRVLNGREARPGFPATTGGTGAIDARPTGAVARPARPVREVEPRVDPRNEDGRDMNRIPDREQSPARPLRTIPRDDLPARNEPHERERAPARVPANPPSREDASPSDRPARPERRDRPAPVDSGARPAPSERRPDPPARVAPPPQRSEPPPRNNPPARNDPPPQRSEPAPRNDPPPQRSEPAPRSEPPAQRSEPARPERDRPPRKDAPR
jgi:uncharacterized protein DUF6600